MKNYNLAKEWIKRAKSNLSSAKLGKSSNDILLEDLCFDAQQCIEKSLKAICILKNIEFQKTHNLEYLVELLEKNNISLPTDLIEIKTLTIYAVETRYPGEYEPVDEYEYQEIKELAEKTFQWADKKISKNQPE